MWPEPGNYKTVFWQETWQSIKTQRNNNALPGLVKKTFTTLVAVGAIQLLFMPNNLFNNQVSFPHVLIEHSIPV